MYVNNEHIKGTVYLDNSAKCYRGDKIIKHNCYRIDVKYVDQRFRDRFGSREQGIEELRRLQRYFSQQKK